ncbi:Polyphosphate kinase 2 (PPK2) [Symmachiella macrocystis]|uniref:ADP/GDP-polyphosphate phosphotransferase n=1 Tax=Symmachiella macrocystis TaxID=2527985 RepID=A0A5C6BT72_9PLAN|nr:polyphosphate kinase 2 [Symmachiella macrocystis]TWU14386.1 Polyphosphate kinase 2 (PPK2) [Symmachiella macrocystis]
MATKPSQSEFQEENGAPRLEEKIPHPQSADGPYPYDKKLKAKKYDKLLLALQIELMKVQKWVLDANQKIAIVFEGRDAAGKGGTIKRFLQHLNPRLARVVALPKPTEAQLGQWYFQRYVAHLPTRGEIAFFDRSWYNRAGVEPVMGYCTPEDYQRFIHQAPEFEAAQIASGLHLFKFWFDVSRKEQRRRIESRQEDPLKHWKLSPMDYEAMQRWDDYTKARDGMFLFTDTHHAPWTIIRSDDKRRARIGAMQEFLNRLPYPDKNESIAVAPDPLIVGPVSTMLPLEGRFMFAEQK